MPPLDNHMSPSKQEGQMPAQATAILAALPLVPPSLHVFMESSYWVGEVATYIARQVIACCASGTPIGSHDLLPRELAEHAATLAPNLPDAEFLARDSGMDPSEIVGSPKY